MSASAFLARQPILDRSGAVVAYELLFRATATDTASRALDPTLTTAEVLAGAFNEMGARQVLRDRIAFVNLGSELLCTDLIELLPKERVVIEILEDVEPTPDLVARVRELRTLGYRFALDDYVHRPAYGPLLDLAEFVKIDVLAVPPADVEAWVRELRPRGLRLLAEKVERRPQHAWAEGAGFDLFQGHYFARPETLSRRVVNSSHVRIARIMADIRRDWDAQAVEHEIKHDPGLTLKLLTYANSVRFGPAVQLRSIRQALALLGQRQLYRWLALLLLTVEGRPQPALVATAVARGRLCELIATNRLDEEACDDLFLTGILSLVPALLECELELLLQEFQLSGNVEHALRERGGKLGPFLALAESVECGDPARVALLAGHLGITPDEVNHAHLSALAWSMDAET